MYDYDWHQGKYSAQVLDFKFTGDSLWLLGVDYTRRDFFDIDVRALEAVEDKVLVSKYSGNRYLMRIKFGNSASPEYLAKSHISECVRRVFKDLNVELKGSVRRIKRCLPSDCLGFVDSLFKVRKVEGGTLFKCCFMDERDTNIVFVPDSGKVSWPWSGYDKLGVDYRYGWYFDKKHGCYVIFLSSGGCRVDCERHNLRLRLEDNGAVDVDSGVVLPYIRLEDVHDYPLYGCQVFRVETGKRADNYRVKDYVIDYRTGLCGALRYGIASNLAEVSGIGSGYGNSVYEALESFLGRVNIVEDEVQPGLPYRRYVGADAGMFKFESISGARITVIECGYFGERENRFVMVPTDKLNGWLCEYLFGENSENTFAKQASFGYSKCANGGVSLWLLLNGKLTKEIRFYKDHADVRTTHGKKFRCEYRTHEQIVRGVVFGTIANN